MGGETDSTESKQKRMLFIYRGMVAMITILGLFLAYSIQHLQLEMAIITSLGIVFKNVIDNINMNFFN